MLSMDRFVFGDGSSSPVAFTVMSLDASNDVLFAKAVLRYEYSYSDNQNQFIAGFFYQNRPSNLKNDPGTEFKILSNIKSSSFHMSANPADLLPGSPNLERENTKRGSSPQLSSALPLSFDIPMGHTLTFSFPAKACSHCIHKRLSFLTEPSPDSATPPPPPTSPYLRMFAHFSRIGFFHFAARNFQVCTMEPPCHST
jgi:hypothetical protein